MTSQEKIRDLYQILVNVQSVEDCEALLDDLCTKKDVEKMAERIYAARLLLQGKTYTQVIGDADISSATLSRVSRCVQYGTGYVKALGEDGMKA